MLQLAMFLTGVILLAKFCLYFIIDISQGRFSETIPPEGSMEFSQPSKMTDRVQKTFSLLIMLSLLSFFAYYVIFEVLV